MSKTENNNNELVQNAIRLAHDLRAPAMVLRGLLKKQKLAANMNQTEVNNSSSSSQDSIIQQSVEQLLALSDHYLAQIKPKAPTRSIDPITLSSFYRTLKQSLVNATALNTNTKITLNNYLPLQQTLASNSLNLICAETPPLQAIFDNLLKNAEEALASAENPEICVTIHQSKDEVFVDVQDNGCGMNDSLIQSILNSSKSVTSSKEQGHGLGLKGVQSQLKTWGAKMEVLSRPGKGSCFTLRFPLIIKISQNKLN